jgi:hypothetical protein
LKHAHELNLLHIVLLISAGSSLYFAVRENRLRTITLNTHFGFSGFAILAALIMTFIQVGLRNPAWSFLAAMAIGMVIGVARGLSLSLRVDRSFKVPRPAGSRHSIWVAALLVGMAVVDAAGAVIGPGSNMWRYCAALVATGCAGLLSGRAFVLAVRVWRMIG